MKSRFKSNIIEYILTGLLILLLSYSIFKMAVTGSLFAAIPVLYQYILLCLLFAKSRFLSHGIKIWGILIIATGIVKIVLQALVSMDNLLSSPSQLVNPGLVVLGLLVWLSGEYSIVLEQKSTQESKNKG